MDRYIARANIDHYLSLLNGSDLTPDNRNTVTKLLVAEEEDKLASDLEHLQFAETRAARGLDRVNYFRKLRDTFADGSIDRARADRMLQEIEATHHLMEQFCRRLREKVNSRGL